MLMLFFACAPQRDPAPEDLEGLTRYLFMNWEDPDLVSEGMANMAIWLDGEGQSEKAQDDGYVLAPLDEEILAGLEYPTRTPLSEMAGASITRNSLYSIDQHAVVIVEEDQRWNAPSKYERYERSLVEGNAEDFLASDANTIPYFIHTDNDSLQERLGIEIPYLLKKNYRWTTTESGNRAIIARSWVPRHGCSDEDGEGGNCLELSFSVDLFYENDDNTTTRMTASWNSLSLIIDLPFDFQVDQLVNGIIAIDDATDTRIEEVFGSP
jgi:hypothetical protein